MLYISLTQKFSIYQLKKILIHFFSFNVLQVDILY